MKKYIMNCFPTVQAFELIRELNSKGIFAIEWEKELNENGIIIESDNCIFNTEYFRYEVSNDNRSTILLPKEKI